jgi:hypothetical protein
MSERSAGICAGLIRRRLVRRDEFSEVEDDLLLCDGMNHSLADIGLALLDGPGMPMLGRGCCGCISLNWYHCRTRPR